MLRIIGYVGGTVLAFALIGVASSATILPLAAAGFMFYLAACGVVGGFGHIQRQAGEGFGAAVVRYTGSNRTEVQWFIFLEAVGVAFALVGFRILTQVLPGGNIALILLGVVLVLPALWLLRRMQRWLQAHPAVGRRASRLFTVAVVVALVFLGLWMLVAILI